MNVRASWLLHWSIRELGKEKQYLAVEDLLLEAKSGRLLALCTKKGALPVTALAAGCTSSALIAEPLEELLDPRMTLEDARYTTAKQFLGQPLWNEARQRIGLIGDLQFDWPGGELRAIEISRGILQDLVGGRYHLTQYRHDVDPLEGRVTRQLKGVE